MSASDSPLREYQAGTVVASKYSLKRVLGTGGMGAVWVARDIVLDTEVAVKLIRPELSTGEAAHRLLDEARAEARLSHPAIVRAFDFGNTEHGAYIAMELLEGRSLGDLLRRCEHISPVMAIQVLLPVLDALAYAHERGVIHRDLTPENIFLSRMQRHIQPKIVDFGIALLETRPVRRITENGTIVGCPRYMSPEQARGEDDIDHRTDLWTVCVVLYEALTGCSPFDAENYNAALRAVLGRTVMPLTELEIGDEELWRIVEKGLFRRRDLRWQSARQLGTALAKWLLRKGVSTDISGVPLESAWGSEPSPDQSEGDVLDDIIARQTESLMPCARNAHTFDQSGRGFGTGALRLFSSGTEMVRAFLARAGSLPVKASVAIAGSGILVSVLIGVRQIERPSEGPGVALEANALVAPPFTAIGPACRPPPPVTATADVGSRAHVGFRPPAPTASGDDGSGVALRTPSEEGDAGEALRKNTPSPSPAMPRRRPSISSKLHVAPSAPRASTLTRPSADWPLRDPNYP